MYPTLKYIRYIKYSKLFALRKKQQNVQEMMFTNFIRYNNSYNPLCFILHYLYSVYLNILLISNIKS